jgi:pimeloyl-ACP methyl ester carboxylesterase
MTHVTFIHGIANKPLPDELLQIWRRALTEVAEPLDLDGSGITSSLVYWADLMYADPDPDVAAHEGVLENSLEAVDAGGGAATPVPETEEEARFLAAMRARLTTLSDAEIAAMAASHAPAGNVSATAGALERVPLPWFLKKPLMAVLLRDVHHYLFDKTFGPPGRSAVPIRQTIRERFRAALSAPGITGPHIVVSHSMGTVIAYDCLKRLPDCPKVDGLITIGSPLGLDEVQDQLRPGWSREDGFPRERVAGAWRNLFDRLDPVCGFDPKLANDYRSANAEAVVDTGVSNPGAWRHSATKYLRQPAFVQALRQMLDT